MVDLREELETKLFEVVDEQQAKARQALKSLKEVSDFLTSNSQEGFDLDYIEELVDMMAGTNWIGEIESIRRVFKPNQTKEEWKALHEFTNNKETK